VTSPSPLAQGLDAQDDASRVIYIEGDWSNVLVDGSKIDGYVIVYWRLVSTMDWTTWVWSYKTKLILGSSDIASGFSLTSSYDVIL